MKYDHIDESIKHLELPKPPADSSDDKYECLEHYKQIIKEKLDEAFACEQDAAELAQKEAYLRQKSITLQKEAILANFDYG